jgi:hypothetical protein
VLRAAGETETTHENIQDWLQLAEGNPEFQLQTGDEIVAAIILLVVFIISISSNFPFRFLRFFVF